MVTSTTFVAQYRPSLRNFNVPSVFIIQQCCDAENNLLTVLTHLAENKAPSPEGKEPTNTLDELRKTAQLEQESTERSQTENEARLQAEREKKTNEEEQSLSDNKRRTEQEAELALQRQRAAAKQSLVAVLADKMIGAAMLFQVQFKNETDTR